MRELIILTSESGVGASGHCQKPSFNDEKDLITQRREDDHVTLARAVWPTQH